jgi:hypothetical protein
MPRACAGHPEHVPNRLLVHGLARLPGLRRLPMFKLLAIADIAVLAREHFAKLDGAERRRLVELVRKARLRHANLPEAERAELAALVAKAEPRLFAGLAADRLSPIPLPRRLTHGS